MGSKVDNVNASMRGRERVLDHIFDLDSSDEEFDYDKNLDQIVITNVSHLDKKSNSGNDPVDSPVAAMKPEETENQAQHNKTISLENFANNNPVNNNNMSEMAKRRRDRELIRNGKPSLITAPPTFIHKSVKDHSPNVSVAVSPSSTNVKSLLKSGSSENSSTTLVLAGNMTNHLHISSSVELNKKRGLDTPLLNSPKRSAVVVDLTVSDDDDDESHDVKPLLPLKVPKEKQYIEGHEVIDLSDISTDEGEYDAESDQQIRVKHAGPSDSVYSLSSPSRNVQQPEEMLILYKNRVEQARQRYNEIAQQLIGKKMEQGKTAELISRLRNDIFHYESHHEMSELLRLSVEKAKNDLLNLYTAHNRLSHVIQVWEMSAEQRRREFLHEKQVYERIVRNIRHGELPLMDFQHENAAGNSSRVAGYESNVYTDDSSSLRTLLNNIKPDDTYIEGLLSTPEQLTISLLKHQRIGLAWLQDMEKSPSKGGILADDMGLGKTVQMLLLMVANAPKDPNCKTTLIVAPIALLKQWQQEIISKIRPEFAHQILIFHSQDKVQTFEELLKFDVVLISYNTLLSEFKKHYALGIDQALLPKHSSVLPARESGGQLYRSPFYSSGLRFHRIILDEAQWIKNKLTQMSKCVVLLDAQYRWCLSGTPMQNSIDELFSLLRFLRIKPYSNEHRFRSDILLPIKNATSDKYDSYDTSNAFKKLQLLLKLILLRRTKDSQIDGKPILELPDKVVEMAHVEMCKEERDYYKQLEQYSANKADELMANAKDNHGYYSSILSLLLRLRQLCCHKYLVEVGVRKMKDNEKSDLNIRAVHLLKPNVVDRVRREAENGFTCPICYDSIPEGKIALLGPCGHALCDDCVPNFFEQYQISSSNNNDGGNDGTEEVARCVNCRSVVLRSHVVNYDLFDMIHNRNMSDQAVANQMTQVNFSGVSRIERRKQILKIVEEQELNGELQSSLKIDLCVSKIEEVLLANPDEKIIVFSQFTLLFEVIRLVLEQKQISLLQYDGSMTSDDRNATISKFYRDPSQRVLLLSLKAGNVGLTLTCANHVIIMDPFWNPYVEEQALDRAHRIGQKREVHIHRLLIRDTVEDRILKLQEQKRELINGALDSQGLATISRLGRNEIRFLFGLSNL